MLTYLVDMADDFNQLFTRIISILVAPLVLLVGESDFFCQGYMANEKRVGVLDPMLLDLLDL